MADFNNFQSETSLVERCMTNSLEKQAAYVSCRFVHPSVVFCQLFSVRDHCKGLSQTTHPCYKAISVFLTRPRNCNKRL